MKSRKLFFLLPFCSLFTLVSAHGADPVPFPPPAGAILYGINDQTPASIFEVDPTTGAVSHVETAEVSGSESGVQIFSLATQPGTNTIYCVYQETYAYRSTLPLLNGNGFPVSLGTIVPATGAITHVADFSYESETVYGGIPGITFCCDGKLYAVTGGRFPGGGTPSSNDGMIYMVNPATAELTLVTPGGQGSAHSLECNPEDGQLYHFYTYENDDSEPRLEKIDPATGAVTPIGPMNGDVYDIGIQGVVYAGGGRFLGHQSPGTSFYVISSAGVVGYVGPSPVSPNYNVRGLAYSKAIGCVRYQPDLLIGKRRANLKVDDFYTRTGHRQTIRGIRLRGRVGRSATVPFEIQNDGTVPDRIRLRWSFENLNRLGDRIGTGPRFRRQIFAIGGGGGRRNVTNAIQVRGLNFGPGEKQSLVFKLTVRREPARAVSRRQTHFHAVSLGDRSKIDVGNAIFRIRK